MANSLSFVSQFLFFFSKSQIELLSGFATLDLKQELFFNDERSVTNVIKQNQKHRL